MNLLERLLPKTGDVVMERFELESELGRGGFGIVYKARQKSLDEPVAVKILLPHVLSHEALVERFDLEVAVAKGLKHPNTITILDYGRTEEGFPFYVMEFIAGRPLSTELRESGPLDEQRTVRVTSQILKSLAEAHAHGVIHRDLKPANVMLCEIFGEQDFVKVLDFGIAKALTANSKNVTATGLVLGSPPYMSPEQCRGSKQIDLRSDLYSVGLIMAECLTARVVVTATELPQVLVQHISDQPLEFPARVHASRLWPIIERATAKDPETRFGSAVEMRLAIENLSLRSEAANQQTSASFPPVSSLPQVTPASIPPSNYLSSGQSPVLYTGETLTPQPGDSMGAEAPGAGQTDVRMSRGLLVATTALVVVVLLLVVWVLTKGNGDPQGSPASTANVGNDASSNPTVPTEQGMGLEQPTREDDANRLASEAATGLARELIHTAAPVVEVADDEETLIDPRESVLAAHQALHTSIPGSHEIAFHGTNRARIYLGDDVIGQVNDTITVPDLDLEVELVFRRSGHRPEARRINLHETELVTIDLERVPDQETTPTEEATEAEERDPFGSTEFY